MLKILLLTTAILILGSDLLAQKKETAMKTLMERAKLTCKLTTPELQERKKTVVAELKSLLKERKEESNSIRYKFESTDSNIDLISSFIKTERLCCDFFEFDLKVESDSQFLWLELSGPEGVKDFIREEIGF